MLRYRPQYNDDGSLSFVGMDFGSPLRIVKEDDYVALVHKPSSVGWHARGERSTFPAMLYLFTKQLDGYWTEVKSMETGRDWVKIGRQMKQLAFETSSSLRHKHYAALCTIHGKHELYFRDGRTVCRMCGREFPCLDENPSAKIPPEQIDVEVLYYMRYMATPENAKELFDKLNEARMSIDSQFSFVVSFGTMLQSGFSHQTVMRTASEMVKGLMTPLPGGMATIEEKEGVDWLRKILEEYIGYANRKSRLSITSALIDSLVKLRGEYNVFKLKNAAMKIRFALEGIEPWEE